MLDINLLRNQPELVKTALKNRQKEPKLVDQVLDIDGQYRLILAKAEDLKAQQNSLSRQIKGKPGPAQIKLGTALKNQIKDVRPQLDQLKQNLTDLLEQIPNLPSDDTPVGQDDKNNQVIKTVGKIPQFDFQPLDHLALGEKLDILDVQKAAQISGSRFGYFKNQAAVLEMAVMFYALSKLVKKGWTAMIPPAMIKKNSEWKLGYNSNKNLDNAYYSIPEDDLIFISSSEHSVVPYHMDEIIDPSRLPLKYVNFSPCFRRESGTYGKDTRGLFRVHFFNKVEMNVFALPDLKVSDALCQEMLQNEEELMQEFGLPYQVVAACTGDLPQPNRRMFDINSWFPGQNTYRETQSCSNCTDYQARRLNTKTKIDGQNQFVHILNATLVTDRAVLAIIENFQQKDGSIKIPQVLQTLTGFDIIRPSK
ncbi:serine--tRNA ligase [Patescibacteria group bacterium]|nr:serine--tRNA ligase [Patescibacteria group bacterium]